MSRRILYRALAVVVALAAIAPLFFGADLHGSAPGEAQKMHAQVVDSTATLGIPTPVPPLSQHH